MKKLVMLIGVTGASLSAVFVRWSTAPSLVLVLYRGLFATLLLAPYALIFHREELRRLRRREVLLCLASGVFLGLHFFCYFEHVFLCGKSHLKVELIEFARTSVCARVLVSKARCHLKISVKTRNL